jgi:hypothetical protein
MAMGEGAEGCAGEDSAAAVGARVAAALLGRTRRGRRDVRAGAAPPPRAAVRRHGRSPPPCHGAGAGRARAGAGRARTGGRWGERGAAQRGEKK